MDRTEAIKSSIKKWHPGIWNEMEVRMDMADMNSDSIPDRYHIFRIHMWHTSCGFCVHYKDCSLCPLHPDYCMSNMGDCLSSHNVISEIVKAWEEEAVNMFHRQRRKLVKFMASQLIENDCECDMCDGIGVV